MLRDGGLEYFEEILLRGLRLNNSRCACLRVAFIGSPDAILFCAAESVNNVHVITSERRFFLVNRGKVTAMLWEEIEM